MARPHKLMIQIDSIPPFPHCKLHDDRIVDSFPDGCPLAAPDILAALGVMQDNGWRMSDGVVATGLIPTEGITLLDRFDACNSCVDRMRLHPVVQYLRGHMHAPELAAGSCVRSTPASDGNASTRSPTIRTGATTYHKRRRATPSRNRSAAREVRRV